MDRRFLEYYRGELQHIRRTALEFAEENPRIARRLGIDEELGTDPYVERLLEGFAFVAARIQTKLDAEFPRFVHNLLETVYPHYLAPTPSMMMVKFTPDFDQGALAEGYPVPRQTVVRVREDGRDRGPVGIYRTAHHVDLYPIRLESARYLPRQEIGELGITDDRFKAALTLQLKVGAGVPFNEVKMDRLAIYLRGTGDVPWTIYEHLLTSAGPVMVRAAGRKRARAGVRPGKVMPVGFKPEEALLQQTARSFEGYRLLKEYFDFPLRYRFFALEGLLDGVSQVQGDTLDLIIPLEKADRGLQAGLDANSFQLFCTPAINLFPKRADRIHVTEKVSEFHVVPDRSKPLDFEVFQVTGVTGFGRDMGEGQHFDPFYRATSTAPLRGRDQAFFAVNRVPRILGPKDQRRRGLRSSYHGSEIYVSIVDAEAAPWDHDLRQLGVEALCTNRDLPLLYRQAHGLRLDLDIGAPVEKTSCIEPPTEPKPSLALGETAWRLVSHLSLNYLSLVNTDRREGAKALRALLELYADSRDSGAKAEIEAVKAIVSRPVMRRVDRPGPIAFARGLELTLELEENRVEGSCAFLMGFVLKEFFARYVSLNSFTETELRTERGVVHRWPAVPGKKDLL